MYNFFFQLVYTTVTNILFALNNVSIAVMNSLPDGNKTIDLMGIGARIITDAEGENPEVEHCSVSTSAAHVKHTDATQDYVLVSCGTDSKQTRRGFYVKQYVNGKAVVMVMAPTYATTEVAQDDESLEPGAVYLCNGLIYYKQ